MAPASSTVSLPRRAIHINVGPPIIVGIIAGVVTLNVLIMVAWCVVKQRRAAAQRKNTPRALAKAENLDADETLDAKPRRARSSPKKPKRVPPPQPGQQATYQQLMLALQTPKPHEMRKKDRQGEKEKDSDTASVVSDQTWGSPLTREAPEAFLPSLPAALPAATLRPPLPPANVRRHSRDTSAETESIYSAASAPLDAHDSPIYQSFALDAPAPAAPWGKANQPKWKTSEPEPRVRQPQPSSLKWKVAPSAVSVIPSPPHAASASSTQDGARAPPLPSVGSSTIGVAVTRDSSIIAPSAYSNATANSNSSSANRHSLTSITSSDMRTRDTTLALLTYTPPEPTRLQMQSPGIPHIEITSPSTPSPTDTSPVSPFAHTSPPEVPARSPLRKKPL